MISPFGTSLRRDPNDPRGLADRIDAVVLERLEEAVDFICLDLLVQRRRHHGRSLPEARNEQDREEFRALVVEFLAYLRAAYWEDLPEAHREKVAEAEARAGREELRRLMAAQATLAKQLPDYWPRLDLFKADFTRKRLAARTPKPGFLGRLLGR